MANVTDQQVADITNAQHARRAGMSVEDYLKYSQNVVKPNILWHDFLTGKDGDKWNEYFQKIKDLRYNELQATNANEYNAMREDTTYQRLEKDMRKAGISPYFSSMSAATAQPAVYNSMKSNAKTDNSNKDAVNNMKAIVSAIATAVAAIALLA